MRTLRFLSVLLIAVALLAIPAASSAQIGVGLSIRIGPPVIPVYAQPVCPGAGFMWTPGYWAYAEDGGYYWVPGTWVQPPMVGVLWTPGYWGWGGGLYAWHGGYWGPHVGFYGGINYGFGYGGVGFGGGMWVGGAFRYNTAVSNVGVNIHNTYVDKTVINNNSSHVSFNGGTGGTTARPTPAENAAANERHIAPTSAQTQQEHAASTNKSQFYSANHGQPSVAGTSKAGDFGGAHLGASEHPATASHNGPANTPNGAHPANTPNGTHPANGANPNNGGKTNTNANANKGTTPGNDKGNTAGNNKGNTNGANKGGTPPKNNAKTPPKNPPKNPPKGGEKGGTDDKKGGRG